MSYGQIEFNAERILGPGEKPFFEKTSRKFESRCRRVLSSIMHYVCVDNTRFGSVKTRNDVTRRRCLRKIVNSLNVFVGVYDWTAKTIITRGSTVTIKLPVYLFQILCVQIDSF